MKHKTPSAKNLMKILHKFARYTKHQRIFVLYLVVLVFFLLLFPVLKVTPVDGGAGYSIWLFSGSFFKTMLIIFISLGILVGWNTSFKFKNIIISYFGFKENDALFNFGFLWVITTAFLAIGDTIGVVRNGPSAATNVTFWYYIIELLLILGLILTLVSIIQKAKVTSKTKIINIVDEEAVKTVKNRGALKGLFEEGSE